MPEPHQPTRRFQLIATDLMAPLHWSAGALCAPVTAEIFVQLIGVGSGPVDVIKPSRIMGLPQNAACPITLVAAGGLTVRLPIMVTAETVRVGNGIEAGLIPVSFMSRSPIVATQIPA